MKSITADSSVIVKLYAQEEDSNKANTLLTLISLKKIKLILPEAASLELLNTLILSKDYTNEEINDVLDKFFDLNNKLVNVDKSYAQEIAAIMHTYHLTSYDASFIALAISRNIPLITADYKHHQKFISKNIIWLKDWQEEI